MQGTGGQYEDWIPPPSKCMTVLSHSPQAETENREKRRREVSQSVHLPTCMQIMYAEQGFTNCSE